MSSSSCRSPQSSCLEEQLRRGRTDRRAGDVVSVADESARSAAASWRAGVAGLNQLVGPEVVLGIGDRSPTGALEVAGYLVDPVPPVCSCREALTSAPCFPGEPGVLGPMTRPSVQCLWCGDAGRLGEGIVLAHGQVDDAGVLLELAAQSGVVDCELPDDLLVDLHVPAEFLVAARSRARSSSCPQVVVLRAGRSLAAACSAAASSGSSTRGRWCR